MTAQHSAPRREPINPSLDPESSAEARRWIEENREALLSSNAYVERHGLPLAKHPIF
jgi:post-segregation antitoxin (ccd killing protein)